MADMNSKFKFKKIIAGLIILIIFLITYRAAAYPHIFGGNLQQPVNITVAKGDTVNEIGLKLKENGLISSVNLFKLFVKIKKGNIAAGIYQFSEYDSIAMVAHRMTHQDFRVKQLSLVIPEGYNEYDIAEAMKKVDPNFNELTFLQIVAQADRGEGYLFPDTYQIFPETKADELYKMLTANFDQKTAALKQEALAKNLDWENVIIMASLIEGEANNEQDRTLVSSVFYNRLEKGIALQSDVPFRKINGKTTKELTLQDLKIKSVFNTYTTPGLPPEPLNNPGLAAIKAAIYPANTDYLYFLTGDDGITRFSKTLEEHAALKRQYIK